MERGDERQTRRHHAQGPPGGISGEQRSRTNKCTSANHGADARADNTRRVSDGAGIHAHFGERGVGIRNAGSEQHANADSRGSDGDQNTIFLSASRNREVLIVHHQTTLAKGGQTPKTIALKKSLNSSQFGDCIPDKLV